MRASLPLVTTINMRLVWCGAVALDLAQALQVPGARIGTGAGAGARILSHTRCGAPVAQALALEVGIAAEVQELGASNNPCDGGIRPRLRSGLGLGYPRSLMRSAPKWCWCWSWSDGVGVGVGVGAGVGVGVGRGGSRGGRTRVRSSVGFGVGVGVALLFQARTSLSLATSCPPARAIQVALLQRRIRQQERNHNLTALARVSVQVTECPR